MKVSRSHCGQLFSRPDSLQRHIHTKHSIVASGGLSKQPETKSHHVALQDKHYQPLNYSIYSRAWLLE